MMVVTPPPPTSDPARPGDSQWPPIELGPARVAVVLSTSNTTQCQVFMGDKIEIIIKVFC